MHMLRGIQMVFQKETGNDSRDILMFNGTNQGQQIPFLRYFLHTVKQLIL